MLNLPTIRTIPQSVDVPFDNSTNGFTAIEAQSAIEEAKQNAEGFPRAGISRIYNGTVSGNSWLGPSELLPNTPFCTFPVKVKINEISWSNQTTDVSFDIEFRTVSKMGTIFHTLSVRNGTISGYESGLSYTINAGGIIYAQYKDFGTNVSDFELTLWISRVP